MNISKGYKLVPVELLEKLSALWPDGAENDGSSRFGWLPHLSEAVRNLKAIASDPTQPQPIHSALSFVCTALPGPGNECVFVELENDSGESLGYGEWRQRGDGLVELHIAAPQPIYDEPKERELARFSYDADSEFTGGWFDYLYGWLACAQSRAKAGEVGHD